MSDIIKLLPDSVANQIAAGEVIQRPASVIKELVENSVDAGATEISLTIRDAGKTLIQIVDNGTGMSETDVRMAFERHATSKIRKADDLFHLRSMGFRGEALPSICAISEVNVRTRTDENPLGTHLVIEASKVKMQEACAAERGTVISVKRLFFNVPARRKFLKSDSVELSNIMREFERLALVNHNLRMSIDTGSKTISLRPGTFRQRIEEIWKNSLKSEHLLPVNTDTRLVKIEGFISRPEFARRRNPLQYLIVNGRNMRHPYFHKAIMNCYDQLIAPGTQPCYFLMFTVDPDTIDVNIHPTKNEIKFENEQEIWPILTSAVKLSLGRFSAVPSIDFNSDTVEIQPLRGGEVPTEPRISFNPEYNPFLESAKEHKNIDSRYRPTKVESNWQSLYEGLPSSRQSEGASQEQSVPADDLQSAIFDQNEIQAGITPICLQYSLKYIITTSHDGLMIIDQHRAHVKILYEDYLKRTGNSSIVSQTLMFPETVSLDESQQAALAEVQDDLAGLGFNVEYSDGTDWQIMSAPAMLKPHDIRDVLLRILDSVTEDSANYGNEQLSSTTLREKAALIMARSGAIRRGVRLTVKEMEDLTSRLFSLPDPMFTPNGNKVYTILSEQQIGRLFESTVIL